ncbi:MULTISPECIES: FAD-dependent oxidoreductase [unclassified Helicobacter]|uniref:FAD-dependent oxidoreductase n=1 Tax=unclassified Helicobacter TaxID=2593540 RepID=UPI000CF0A001|nr:MULTISPECIES: FAD-dependent oxidoreductase [unclassified Helicobacter]
MKKEFDVVIIGGGISGTALFYVLSEYSDISSIAIVDKCHKWANVSSSTKGNSQTLHDGSIETNYSFEKASKVRFCAHKVKNYALRKNLQNKAIFEMQKMAIGVGDIECEAITKRHQEFQSIFPQIQFFDKQQIKTLEPKVIEGKDGGDRFENVVAMGYEKDWCGVDYAFLSENFVQEGMQKNPNNQTFLNFWVKEIKPKENGYVLVSQNKQEIYAKFILVNAGSYSLPLAQSMGYGLNFGCLPVAGNFYFVPNLLRGKVYTIQNPKLPFAAIHGDPDIIVKDKTRIGPTALVIPKFEKGKNWFNNLSPNLLKLNCNLDILKTLKDLILDKEIREYMMKNILFEFPYIGKKKFLADAQKIIPSLKLNDLEFANGYGEVRPQVLDKTEKKLILGEQKIHTKKGITFNMTPSPGATSCLHNAMIDAQEITQYLGRNFDLERFYQELSPQELI